jgi:hypothetical protein
MNFPAARKVNTEFRSATLDHGTVWVHFCTVGVFIRCLDILQGGAVGRRCVVVLRCRMSRCLGLGVEEVRGLG